MKRKFVSLISVISLFLTLSSCEDCATRCSGCCRGKNKHITNKIVDPFKYGYTYRPFSSINELYMAFRGRDGEWFSYSYHPFFIQNICDEKGNSSNGGSTITIGCSVRSTFDEEQWFEKYNIELLKMEYKKKDKYAYFTFNRKDVVFIDKAVDL
jgi:hypothetical protein